MLGPKKTSNFEQRSLASSSGEPTLAPTLTSREHRRCFAEVRRILKRGQTREKITAAAAVFEIRGLAEEAVALLLHFGFVNEAIGACLRSNHPDKAAAICAQHRQWKQAAEFFARASQPRKAAQCLSANNDFGRAGRLFEQAGDYSAAARCAAKLESFEEEFRLWILEGDFTRAQRALWSATERLAAEDKLDTPAFAEKYRNVLLTLLLYLIKGNETKSTARILALDPGGFDFGLKLASREDKNVAAMVSKVLARNTGDAPRQRLLSADSPPRIPEVSVFSTPRPVSLEVTNPADSIDQQPVAEEPTDDSIFDAEAPTFYKPSWHKESLAASETLRGAFEMSELFRSLSKQERHSLWRLGKVKEFTKEEVIVEIASIPQGVITILSGEVDILSMPGGKGLVAKDTVKASGCIGQCWALLRMSSQIQIRSREAAAIHVIDRRDIKALFNSNKSEKFALGQRFLESINNYLYKEIVRKS